jgi:hypothetical protein
VDWIHVTKDTYQWQAAENMPIYKVVQIWPGLFVCKHVTVCRGHTWTTLYFWIPKKVVDLSILHRLSSSQEKLVMFWIPLLSAGKHLVYLRQLIFLCAFLYHPQRRDETMKLRGNFFNHEDGSGKKISA